jgi:hypothetical protein
LRTIHLFFFQSMKRNPTNNVFWAHGWMDFAPNPPQMGGLGMKFVKIMKHYYPKCI